MEEKESENGGNMENRNTGEWNTVDYKRNRMTKKKKRKDKQ